MPSTSPNTTFPLRPTLFELSELKELSYSFKGTFTGGGGTEVFKRSS